MKPQQPNVEYCIEHKEFVNGLLEKRGWRDGDWYIDAAFGPILVSIPPIRAERLAALSLDAIWLPSEGDVLAMLAGQGIRTSLAAVQQGTAWSAWAFPPGHYRHADNADTPLIALLELLKAVEEKG